MDVVHCLKLSRLSLMVEGSCGVYRLVSKLQVVLTNARERSCIIRKQLNLRVLKTYCLVKGSFEF